MEDIIGIANAVKERVVDESSKGFVNRAIARVVCEKEHRVETYFLTNKLNVPMTFGRDFLGRIISFNSQQTTSDVGGIAVNKNTLLGRALIGELGREAEYAAPRKVVRVTPVNRAVYNPCGDDACDVQIQLSGDANHYNYATLAELLNLKKSEEAKLQAERKRIEELKKEQELLKQKEAEAQARALAEERERLEREREERKREEQTRLEEIARIEQSIADASEEIKKHKDLLRKDVMLRSQHILDPFQEDAKRSHIYDNVPIVIDGGPGTGKTTTVVQRLKFLLSKPSLEEYGAPLTGAQLRRFEDPHRWSQQWLFFSPTDLLLQFLRKNMSEEELIATDTNTRTIERFRKVMLREYGIIDPSKPKFKDWKDKNGEKLILSPKKAISAFEKYCVDQVKQICEKLISFETSSFEWSAEAERIKQICSRNNVVDIASLMKLLETLYEYRDENVKTVTDLLKESVDYNAMAVKLAVMKDADATARLRVLFAQWRQEARQIINQSDDSEDETLDDSEEPSEAEIFDFDAELYTKMKSLIRNLGLKQVDSNVRIRGRQQELLKIVEPFIEAKVTQNDLNNIGEFVLFSKNFAVFCRGTESIFINKIPQMYRDFRKEVLSKSEPFFDIGLLSHVIEKDGNKCLHQDEQNLLLGFINEMLITFSKLYRARFAELKGRMSKSYKDYCRPIIGIDEATDYTLMDYYCMVSFRYNEFSSITLSGDIMQGMHKHGISSWEDLKELFPKLEVFTLNISYRQSPTLVGMARELYKDSLGDYPSYNSQREKTDGEAKPVLLISDDMTTKVEWICRHILSIFGKYEQLPSIAIFVGDDVDVSKLIEEVEDSGILNGIEVVNCTGGRTLDSKEVVRVFRLAEIKGMEFEAAFFYDIDTAIQGKSSDLMRRNLYVGVSRAASHLAATMTKLAGNEEIIRYFETENTDW